MKPAQSEFLGGEGGFMLISEPAVDGERITREKEQREKDHAESESDQTNLFDAD